MDATSTGTRPRTAGSGGGPLLWTARDVADALGVSERKVWTLHATERLPEPVRLGDRSTRWRRADIERWIAAGCPIRVRFAELEGER